jgi:hypothetical protein
LEESHKTKGHDVAMAFRELRRRVGREYYRKAYPVQAQTMDYSQLAFPAYRFILPEVLADDWLATVGWHKFSRDHVLHQPLTAYVVLKLLAGGGDASQGFVLADGNSLLDACVNEILKWQGTSYLRDFLIETGVQESEPWLDGSEKGKALWRTLFIETAYLAASFHDMGYPWQYVNLLNNKLDHAGLHSDSPTGDAERLIETFGDRLLFAPLNGYRFLDRSTPATWRKNLIAIATKALRKTHGFPGAIGFLFLNDILRDYPREDAYPIRQFCIEWAAMAILMHDMPKIYWGDHDGVLPSNGHMRLRFDVDPLSCIIALADLLEDFARPVAQFGENLRGVELTYDHGCESTKLELLAAPSPRGMRIEFQFADPIRCASKREYLPADQKVYFDSPHGYIDFSAAGIDRVEMSGTVVGR